MIGRAFPWFRPSSSAVVPTPSLPPPIIVDPTGNPTHAWMSGESLLADRNRAVLLKRIARLAGLPAEDFDALYVKVACSFAEYVQLLPASENHHHARLGGLLDHSLDVAERALAVRRSYLLPPNRAPEVVARSADRWTYAVFLAALLHDAGKPATDLEVKLYERNGSPLSVWLPAAGGMTEDCRYYVRYRDDRLYDRHQRMTPFIARSLIPEAALSWISDDHDLMASWLSCLLSDYESAGPIGEIVAQADGESVAADLGAGEGIRLTSSRKRPLNEMLMLALKHVFEDGHVKINRPGAEAWVTETDVWFVSRVCCEVLRSWLFEQGFTSVPSNNHRIFDEFQQNRLCTPTDEGKAVWSMRVKVGDFDQKLTMLRFSIDKIWPDRDRRPAVFEGEIEQNALTRKDASQTVDEPHESDSAATDLEASSIGYEDDLAPTVIPFDTMRPKEDRSPRALAAARDGDRKDWEPIVDSFLAWLGMAIKDRHLALNSEAGSGDVWTVEEGLFIRTPGIYRNFANEHDVGDYVPLQKALERRDALLKNLRSPPTTSITYKRDSHDSAMKGNVLLRPEAVLEIKLPPADKRMKRARGKGGFY